MLTAAALTKETTLVTVGAALLLHGIHALRDRHFKADDLLLLIPPVIFVGWKIALFQAWNVTSEGWGNVLGIPVRAWTMALKSYAATGTHAGLVHVVELLVLAFIGVLIAASLWQSTADAVLKIAWTAYAVLLFSLTSGIWIEDWAFMRAASEYLVLGGIVAITSDRSARYACGIVYAFLWVLIGWQIVFYR